MNNSVAGKSIISQIDVKKKNLSNKFDKEENDLRQKESKLVSQKNLLKNEEFEIKVNFLKEEIDKYNSTKQESVTLLNKKKVIAENELAKEISILIGDHAEKNSISIILHKNSIIIGKKDLDLTSVILKNLNDKLKKIKIK